MSTRETDILEAKNYEELRENLSLLMNGSNLRPFETDNLNRWFNALDEGVRKGEITEVSRFSVVKQYAPSFIEDMKKTPEQRDFGAGFNAKKAEVNGQKMVYESFENREGFNERERSTSISKTDELPYDPYIRQNYQLISTLKNRNENFVKAHQAAINAVGESPKENHQYNFFTRFYDGKKTKQNKLREEKDIVSFVRALKGQRFFGVFNTHSEQAFADALNDENYKLINEILKESGVSTLCSKTNNNTFIPFLKG